MSRSRPDPARFTFFVVVVSSIILHAAALAQVKPGAVNEDVVREIAAELRCVVCQNLSVADSPSETANQMRGIIRERLAAGDNPEQVVAYFVEKYGEWILLSPPKRGLNLLVWGLPFLGIFGGLVVLFFVTRRWSRAAPLAPEPVDPEALEKVRRELRGEGS